MLGSLTGFAMSYSAMATDAATTTTKGGVNEMSFLPVLMSLGVVIVAILLLAAFYKKMNFGFANSRGLKIVTSLSLGTKERIVVIEVKGQQHVIGVTANQINHLITLDEPLEQDTVSGDQNNTSGLSFEKVLQGISKK